MTSTRTPSTGSAVSGRVLDSGGSPVAGALVNSGWEAGTQEATTDRDGRFVMRGLREGEVGLGVAAEGFVERSIRVRTASTAEVRLTQLARLRVQVLDEDGLPVARASVVVSYGEGDIRYGKHLQTLQDGRAQCALKPQTVEIRVRLPGEGWQAPPRGRAEVPLTEGEERVEILRVRR